MYYVQLRSRGALVRENWYEGQSPSRPISLCALSPDDHAVFSNSLSSLFYEMGRLIVEGKIQECSTPDLRLFVYDGQVDRVNRLGALQEVASYWEVEILWSIPAGGKDPAWKLSSDEVPHRRFLDLEKR